MSLDPEAADVRLDVREIDGEPFGDITAALEALSDDESLLLLAGFEPRPLYDVLEGRGFEYATANPEPDLWQVEVERA